MKPHSVAVLGASDKPERYSNMLIRKLRDKGHSVFPVHPALRSIEEIPVYRTLADLPAGIDVLSVYVNPLRSAALADAIVQTGIRRVIFNPGAENPELEERLARSGIQVEEACSLVLSGMGKL